MPKLRSEIIGLRRFNVKMYNACAILISLLYSNVLLGAVNTRKLLIQCNFILIAADSVAAPRVATVSIYTYLQAFVIHIRWSRKDADIAMAESAQSQMSTNTR